MCLHLIKGALNSFMKFMIMMFLVLCVHSQDSLSKFVGRTLQDCGEDLLVEISEILFNELAFFRLMQDLDQNTSKNKCRTKRRSDHTSPKHSPRAEVGSSD